MSEAIVNCAAYADGRRVADLDLEAISDWVVKDGHFVWIGLHEPAEDILRKVQAELDLHELAVEDALRAHQRPKLEEYDQGLFVVMRTAMWNAATRNVDLGETHAFVGPRYVVSVRHGASAPYTDLRAHCEANPRLLRHGPAFVLYALMDVIVDRYFPVLDALEEELDRLEEVIFSPTVPRDVAERIYDLKWDAIALKRAVSPLVDVCNRLSRYDQGLIADDCRPYFRDVYDHVVRINESVDTVRELLTSALEANLSLTSIRQNEVMKTLAGWAAIFGAVTVMAGIWGMNFDVMPELHQRWGYPAGLGLMGAVAGVMYWRLKRAGWL
jgi:magnesium transporter